MYGIHNNNSNFSEREQRLKEKKNDLSATQELHQKFDQLKLSMEKMNQEQEELRMQMDNMKHEQIEMSKSLFGNDPSEEATEGYINHLRIRIDEQREEYFGLIEEYMNKLDKNKVEEIENRLVKLETDKPKLSLVSSASRIPTDKLKK